jgi:hypothetical protein
VDLSCELYVQATLSPEEELRYTVDRKPVWTLQSREKYLSTLDSNPGRSNPSVVDILSLLFNVT